MGVERFYSGIINPSGGMYQGTDGGGVYDGILPGATGAPSGELTTRSVRTVKIDPYTGQPITPTFQQGMTGRGQPLAPATAQPTFQKGMMGRGSAPQPEGLWSPYLTEAERQKLSRQITAGNQVLSDHGMLAGQPPVLAGMFGRGVTLPGQPQTQMASASVPLPRIRPVEAPWAPELAAVMSPNSTLDDLLAYAKSTSPHSTPAATAATDLAGAMPGTSLASLFGSPRASVRPADAYAAANALGAINAQQKRSSFSGVGTNGYTYVNGKNVGYSAEEQAKRDALGKALGEANRHSAGNSTHDVAGNNNAFMSTDHQNSTRWQTGY